MLRGGRCVYRRDDCPADFLLEWPCIVSLVSTTLLSVAIVFATRLLLFHLLQIDNHGKLLVWRPYSYCLARRHRSIGPIWCPPQIRHRCDSPCFSILHQEIIPADKIIIAITSPSPPPPPPHCQTRHSARPNIPGQPQSVGHETPATTTTSRRVQQGPGSLGVSTSISALTETFFACVLAVVTRIQERSDCSNCERVPPPACRGSVRESVVPPSACCDIVPEWVYRDWQ
jgi:hypothetical protein